MGLLSKRSAALTAALGISLAAFVPATASAEPVAPASLCAPAASSVSPLLPCLQSLPSELAAETSTSGIEVKGSVDNPVTVTPSEFGKLITKFWTGSEFDQQVDFGLGQLYTGSKETVNKWATQLVQTGTLTADDLSNALKTEIMVMRIDETHYFGSDSQTKAKLDKLDAKSAEAYDQEFGELTKKWEQEVGITSLPNNSAASSIATLKLYAQKWNAVLPIIQENNKLVQKYVGSDLIITSDNLASTVARQGGYGLLKTFIPGPSGTSYDGTATFTVVKVIEETNTGSGGGSVAAPPTTPAAPAPTTPAVPAPTTPAAPAPTTPAAPAPTTPAAPAPTTPAAPAPTTPAAPAPTTPAAPAPTTPAAPVITTPAENKPSQPQPSPVSPAPKDEKPSGDSGGFGLLLIPVIIAVVVGILMNLNLIPRFW